MDYKKAEAIFKAFCDENRLRILELLKAGDRCGCSLLEEMKITQSTLSHHMKILFDSTLVEVRKEGKRVYYSISDEGMNQAKKIIDYFLDHSDAVLHELCDNDLEI